MSMQKLVCPHCHKAGMTVAVNDKIVSGSHHVVCSSCHKPFQYSSDHGKIRISK